MITPKKAIPILTGIILLGIVALVLILNPLLESPKESSTKEEKRPTTPTKDQTRKELPPVHQPTPRKQGPKPRIVVIRNSSLLDATGKINNLQMKRTLNEALRLLFEADSGKAALKQVLTPADKVGLKVNTYLNYKNIATHPELVDALAYFIKEVGISGNNIIIWDRSISELEKAGYRFNRSTRGIRCLATMNRARTIRNIKPIPVMGFNKTEIIVGNVKTRLSNILANLTTVTINMPVLKTQKFKKNTGINTALLNMYQAIEINNQNKIEFYANECDPAAAEIYSIPQIKDKTKLIICDAINPLYNGGPMDDRRYHTQYNGLIVGFDPVALDIVGQSILQKIRQAEGNPEWPSLLSNYLITAGNREYQLGENDREQIEVIEKTLR